ncbi:MAG: orotidine 5'-phosphate decarboxylase [Betaproteobacteria bacterium RIFCSPLOWO2_12_FULL_64_23]|nr:MAG: orotidine 5'-phosphate decarboxylase [Betaproteobacteria bacterium RIFCSPLOWO2_12_FULL_64_23]
MNFIDRLRQAWAAQQTLLCVGLDPDPARLPAQLASSAYPIFEFGRAIVDATADLVCAFKPQIAYYAAARAEDQLEMTIAHIRRHHPAIPVILDAKRGDIGSTAEMYAREAFVRYQADAVTVNPYLGFDSLQPFLDYADKGVIVLCRTSNPGAGDLQDMASGGRKLYEVVAEKAARDWNANANVLLVVGATYPEELREIRSIVGDMPILVPGVGAQGGDVAAVLANGATADGTGLVISSSRAVLYAGSGSDYAQAARSAALKLRDEINLCRKT